MSLAGSAGVGPIDDHRMRGNLWRFIVFRLFFSARFYYPIFTILFLDYGLTLEQFSILNLVWALTIVIAEVPSGALADLFGKRRLVVMAAVLMVIEMALLAFVPLGASALLFWVFFINRICSGLAEAAASGADEALAYDSLSGLGRESEWAALLEKTQRAVSVGFFCTMIIGALAYDGQSVNFFLGWIKAGWELEREVIIRLPVYFTLFTSCITLWAALGMREVPAKGLVKKVHANLTQMLMSPFGQVYEAMCWVLSQRFVWLVLLAALVLDSVPRQLIILASEYYRMIDIPIGWFGFIGAGLSLIGVVTATISKKMVMNRKPGFNFLVLSGILMSGLLGVILMVPYFGVVFAMAAFAVMGMVNFQSSFYINRAVDSRHRATVLSFRGLALNLALGFASLCYTVLIIALKAAADDGLSGRGLRETVFVDSLKFFPPYFAVLFVGVLVAVRVSRPSVPTQA